MTAADGQGLPPMDPLDFDPATFVLGGEFWIAGLRGQEQDSLEAKAPFAGVEMPDGSSGVAVFTDEDLAQRFIQKKGLTAAATPVWFKSTEQLCRFLNILRRRGWTAVILDPTGAPRKEKYVTITDLLETLGEA